MTIPHIIILGSLNMDLVSRVPHHPLPGETLTASSFAVSPGGKGANQAVACAKLSRPLSSPSPSADNPSATAHVAMVGAVGSDSYGAALTANLAAHGVDTAGIRVCAGRSTGIALIVVDEPTGQNRIILSPEANHTLQPEDVAPLQDRSLRAGVLDTQHKPDLVVLQLEIPLPTVLAALRGARVDAVPVLFNPAPAQALPDDIYEGLAHLVVNETEAALLGGVDVAVLDSEEGCASVAAGFLEKGVRNVVITLGGRGVYYANADGKRGLVPAEKANVVDTTGAGDTFVGQYALEAVTSGFEIETAVRKANRVAKLAVERKGAQDSIPWRDEVE